MKWLIRSALTLVTLILIVVVVLIMVPTERVAQLAADRFEATTGRALTPMGVETGRYRGHRSRNRDRSGLMAAVPPPVRFPLTGQS